MRLSAPQIKGMCILAKSTSYGNLFRLSQSKKCVGYKWKLMTNIFDERHQASSFNELPTLAA